MKKLLLSVLALAFAGGLVVLGYVYLIYQDLPDIETLKDYRPPLTSRIYSKDDQVLISLAKEDRQLAQIDEVPQRIIDAFVSAEDDRFFDHAGIDFNGILRAFVANVKTGRVVQGGSTITQQVAKSLLLTSERSIRRKLKDMMLAIQIEKTFSKREILFFYLNQVYLGGGYYGVKAAFKGYFGKELAEVSVAEAALLAGLLVAPGKYSPYNNPRKAKQRQLYVLGQMNEKGKIDSKVYEEAKSQDIFLNRKKKLTFKAPYFTEWVRHRIVEQHGKEKLMEGGLTVRTSLDFKLQEVAEKEVWKGVRDIDRRQGFLGPLKKLEIKEIKDFLFTQNLGLRKESSQRYVFTTTGELIHELTLDEVKEQELSEFLTQIQQSTSDSKLLQRMPEVYQTFLKETEGVYKRFNARKRYEAIVLKVLVKERAILVSMAGVLAIIPWEGFSWAHPRVITDEQKYFQEIRDPSQIVSVGDVIHISFKSNRPMSGSKLLFRLNPKSSWKKFFSSKVFFQAELEQVAKVQAALVALDPHTGEVKALVGGRDFYESQFNRALQSRRQPGSSFKPLIYAAALENGYTPATILMDTPQSLAGVDEDLSWRPRNYDGKFQGLITLRRSLELSRNVSTVNLLHKLGVDNVKKFFDRFQLDVKIPEDLSVSLGSFGISPIDLVSSYAIFPNGGRKISYQSVLSIEDHEKQPLNFVEVKQKEPEGLEEDLKAKSEDLLTAPDNKDLKQVEASARSTSAAGSKDSVKEGSIDFISQLEGDQIYDERLAFIMTSLLRGVVTSGTATRAASLAPFVGGKTGTTNSYVDAWFVGFAKNLVMGVWVGFDDNSTIGHGETGSKAALPIWKKVMGDFLKFNGRNDFVIPDGVVNVLVDRGSGKVAMTESSNTFREFFVDGTEPGGRFSVEKKMEDLNVIDDDEFFSSQ